MPHPNLSEFEWSYHARESYLALLVLRTQGNLITKTFYSNDPNDHYVKAGEEWSPASAQELLLSMAWVPQAFKFSENDPPATDMLTARVRAKYWGFHMITLRPFLKMILDFTRRQEEGISGDSTLFPESRHNKHLEPCIKAGTKSYEEINPTIITCARGAIFALVRSTQAFHGLGEDRLVLTNFFGTAMA